MRIFKTPLFAKWAKREKLLDSQLCQAVKEIGQGLIDADLGGHIYKKRIALQGQGKRGGARSILAYQVKESAFFIFGFTKNEKATISEEDLKIAKVFAREVLKYSHAQLDKLVKDGKLCEVQYER
ncbi:MAG: type II toxin-antitoxin system RelE/ParE family toxin [Gammaproteobacteria bacterium]|nr:type II toxin-antitoxin system RelE/ParE family toxin [Gammaproteobacteria bacterium]